MGEVQGELFPSVTDALGGERVRAIERAAARTIQALQATGTLDASHSLKVELIMQGARALDVEFARNKVTVAAMQLFSKVVDIADGLPTVQQAINDQFEQMVEALQYAD